MNTMPSYFVRVGASLKKEEYDELSKICEKLGKKPGEVCLALLRRFIQSHNGEDNPDVMDKAFKNLVNLS